jgi:cyclase
MLKNRLIPVVLMRGGVCVQSKRFSRYQRLGNPTTIVERLSDWASDELIYLDISDEDDYDLGRDDLREQSQSDPLSILGEVAKRCFMPLTFGGGIRTLDDIARRVQLGADKVAINSQGLKDPDFIDAAAKEFGSQCIVICIDAKRIESDWNVLSDAGRNATGRTAAAWAREAVDRGAGEILVQSIDNDGAGQGFDIPLIQSVVSACSAPVIALGGVGCWEHFVEAIEIGGASAVAAANIFNYTENSVFKAKQHLYGAGCNVRKPTIGSSIREAVA